MNNLKTKQKRIGTLKDVLRLTVIGLLTTVLLSCEGPEGPEGPVGPAGPQGPAGANGQDGTNGTNGTNGSNGSDGQDGQDGQNGADGNSYEDYFNDFEEGSSAGMNYYGDANWFIADKDITGSVNDRDVNTALVNGDIGDSQLIGLSLQLNSEIDQVVEFDAWISSESCCDYLIWYVNDVEENGIAGEGGPFHFTFYVPAGTDSISFIYDKDISVSTGTDNTHLDNIRITNYSATGRMDFSMPDLPSGVRVLKDRESKN